MCFDVKNKHTLEPRKLQWAISTIMIWYIWKARCLKVFHNVTKRLAHTISQIWTKIVRKRRGSLDSLKSDTRHAKLQQLKFHTIQDWVGNGSHTKHGLFVGT